MVSCIGLAFVWKLFLLCVFDAYERGLDLDRMPDADTYLMSMPGQFAQYVGLFCYGLTLLQNYERVEPQEQTCFLTKALELHTRFEAWARMAPVNFSGMSDLLSAEIARVKDDSLDDISESYDKAIARNGQQGFIHFEAISNELAAKFWLTRGKERIAQIYLQEAYYGYQRWGAEAKTKMLEERYPQWLLSSPHKAAPQFEPDVDSLMKAAQAISGEIELEKLLAELMGIMLENAGARTGFLILEHSGSWNIEAQGNVEKSSLSVRQSVPFELHILE